MDTNTMTSDQKARAIALGSPKGESKHTLADQDKMKLRPLDKHYGQRYLMYERPVMQCDNCESAAVVKIDSVAYCSVCFLAKRAEGGSKLA
jgi:hypothetical protein